MEINDKELSMPEEFPFPFAPYDIQLQFMKRLYLVLRDGKLGIFESPTGTGKSLSIICGALKWLTDHNRQKKKSISEQIALLDDEKQKLAADDDWFIAQSKEIEVTRKLNELKIQEKILLEYEEKIEKIKSNFKIKIDFKKFNKIKSDLPELTEDPSPIIEDEDILLLDENSDLDKVEDEINENEYDDNNKYQPTQIIIASRTHSQLSQFIGEIKKSPFNENIRVVSMASRQNYCINPNVRKLNNITLINEKCLDMQKKNQSQPQLKNNEGKILKKQKTNPDCQCPYFKQTNIEELRNFALSQVHDIEDLVQIGQELNGCPYYASRKAAQDAEIVLVPYNTLLHKSTREANGINLKNNVVIIDEAHNLLEALAQMYGSELGLAHLYYSLQLLKCYKQRFNTMFSAVTLRNLNQLIFVVNKLFLMLNADFKVESTEIFTLERFVINAEIDQFNFFNLLKFCKSSKIAQKIRTYSLKYGNDEKPQAQAKKGVKDFLASISKNQKPFALEEEKDEAKLTSPNNPLLAVISFLESLTYSYEDGRILVTKSSEKALCKLQFLLLNPTSNFKEIIEEARSVIVAGGTMKPIEEFRDRLFIGSGASKERIVEFSCDHIIPPENILPIAITKGLRQENLLFNFTNRMSMGSSLKDIIQKACETVKGGIVVFFPSYNYENWVYEQMKSLNLGRTLFREPQKSTHVDEVLEKYASTIKRSQNGAIMFSVVGGKLSEGLNFSDDLGRCVIVVGLPYANITAADLKEKMSFLDKNEGQGAGKHFYENMCMKSVNQCIGRAVRHKNDYATVLLLDERYGKSGIYQALPGWIQRSLKVLESKEAFDVIDKFFLAKNNSFLF